MVEEDESQAYTPGIDELVMAENLFLRLQQLKASDTKHGREWAIAATEAQKLTAWISYVIALAGSDE